MTKEIGQNSTEPIFGPLVARSWLVGTGRAVETDSGLRIREGLDSLGGAALGIMIGEQPPFLSAAYEKVAKVATLSQSMVQNIAEMAIADLLASES